MGGNVEDIESGINKTNSYLNKILDMLTKIKNALVISNIGGGVISLADLIAGLAGDIGGVVGGIGGEIIGSTNDLLGGVIGEIIGEVDGNIIDNKLSDLGAIFTGLADTAKTRFPFSIPWDILFIISCLDAEPIIPYFEIPVVIESVNIKEIIIIDFGNLEPLSKISRTFLTLLWCLFLILSTHKIIKKEGA